MRTNRLMRDSQCMEINTTLYQSLFGYSKTCTAPLSGQKTLSTNAGASDGLDFVVG